MKPGEEDRSAQPGDTFPRPDPTALTTRQLNREVEGVREIVGLRFDALEKEIQQRIGSEVANIITRFEGMDKAIRVLQDIADKFPARIDEKILALKEVHEQKFLSVAGLIEEKFSSVQTQFAERDERTATSRVSDKTAVDAALQAQKESAGKQAEAFQEATNKSEQQFTKQIDQQSELLKTEVRALVTQIGDLKSRFERGEGRGEGVDKQVVVAQSERSNNQWLIGVVIGILIAAVGIIIGVLRG